MTTAVIVMNPSTVWTKTAINVRGWVLASKIYGWLDPCNSSQSPLRWAHTITCHWRSHRIVATFEPFPSWKRQWRSRTQCHENCRNSGNCRNTTILMLSRWCQRRGAWCNLRWTESVARNKPKSEITVNAMTWYFSLTLIHDLLQGHVRSRWPLLHQEKWVLLARVS